jgi:DNA-directed RNA polymerase III subunit RPC11
MELTRAVQCPNEKCRNHEAYWYQLQIRSADEPMTAFYKVSSTFKPHRIFTDLD